MLVFCLVALASPLALTAPALAATVTLTNNTPGVADGSWLNRTVTVGAGDLPAGSTVSTVRVTIDFDKIDAPQGNCAIGHQGGWPYNSDMVFYLTSPAGTKVVLVESYYNWGGSGGACTIDCETYSDEDAYNGPYVIVFDDAAPSAAGPAPLSGTFQPVQPLSAFEGESPFGTWTLAAGDDDLADPLCFAGFDLELTAPGDVTDLVLDETGPATAVAGESITYTIVVTNNGPSVAPLVEILDDLPNEVAFVDATLARSGSGPAGECAYAACQAASVQAGEVLTMTLVGLVDPAVPGGTVLNNQATAFASDDPEPDASDGSTTTVETEAELDIAKVGLPDPVIAGGMLLYQVVVTNTGPSVAHGVVVTDSLPAGTTYAQANSGCSETGGIVTCQFGDLWPGVPLATWEPRERHYHLRAAMRRSRR